MAVSRSGKEENTVFSSWYNEVKKKGSYSPMTLTFEIVDEILKSYGLVSHTIKNGKCTEYSFENKVINVRQKNVATQIRLLSNGGVGGYLYIDHLSEYDNHPDKTKMGHIPICRMNVDELKSTIEKVIKDYK